MQTTSTGGGKGFVWATRLNRITSAEEGTVGNTSVGRWGQSFTIDPWGNLSQVTNTKGSMPQLSVAIGANNRFTTSGYSHDSAGDITADGIHTYVYDAESRLASIDSGATTYTYDANGMRVRKTTGSNFTEYIYWGGDVIAEKNQAGNWTDYIFAGGKRIAKAPGVIATSGTEFYHSDHLGSSRLMTNASGTLVSGSEGTFLPYGEEYTTTTTGNNYKFTGKERDSETTNDYFGARYYSSNMSRWLTPDWAAAPSTVPYADFADPQTLNLYGYVGNRPINRFDTDGHEECFVNGACNSLRNPFSASNWIANGLSNTVSDLLSLDDVAQGSVNMVNAETTAGKVGTGFGLALVVGLNVFTGGEGKAAAKGAELGLEEAINVGGRLGSAETRALDKAVAKGLEGEGYTVTHGAGKPQEYIPGPGGARRGSAYPDVTAVKDGKTVRVNTVDTLKDGKLTGREQRNADKIRGLAPGDEFRTVPKVKK